jgi:hypothetical protein
MDFKWKNLIVMLSVLFAFLAATFIRYGMGIDKFRWRLIPFAFFIIAMAINYFDRFHSPKPIYRVDISAFQPAEAKLENFIGPAGEFSSNDVYFRVQDEGLFRRFYCSNTKSTEQEVTLKFTESSNILVSSEIPPTKRVPAGKEKYFLSIRVDDSGKPWNNQYRSNFKEAK